MCVCVCVSVCVCMGEGGGGGAVRERERVASLVNLGRRVAAVKVSHILHPR
jgi:hypothetical protein